MTDTFVIGHVNPDTDSIASAVGYAWLISARDKIEVTAARAGSLNTQTTWVLDKLQMDPPLLLTDASPKFEAVTQRFDSVLPESSLKDAWSIANRTGGIAPVVSADGKPYGLITGWSLFSYIADTLGPNPEMQNLPLAEVLDAPSENVANCSVPQFDVNGRIKDAISRVLRAEENDFWVVDKQGNYEGIVRQRDLLKPPRMKLILVDHNEPRQSIRNLDEAELIEVLDHHRLDNPSTHMPIRFTVDVVGSTSTLVSERIEEAGLRPPPEIGGLLLAGLLADTLILSSPTTTDRDKRAVDRLARWAFTPKSPLAGMDFQSYGEQVLEAGAGFGSRDPLEIVTTDMKDYQAEGIKFVVAQVEVTSWSQFHQIQPELTEALNSIKTQRGLDFAMLMVTDVVKAASQLLITEAPGILHELPFEKVGSRIWQADGMVSRKKQLIPTIFGLLEG